MSVANIKKYINSNWLVELRANARDKSQRTQAHLITIDTENFAQGMVKGINNAAKIQGFTKEAADLNMIRRHVQTVEKRWAKGQHGISEGVRATFRNGKLVVYRESLKSNSGSLYARKVNAEFRRQVFNLWKKETGIGADWDSDTAKIVGEETPFSHSEFSNVANAGLVQWIEDTTEEIIPINSTLTRTDIAEQVLDAMDIKWSQEYNRETNKTEWVIRGDLTQARKNPVAGEKDLTDKWIRKLSKRFAEIVKKDAKDKNGEFFSADFQASPSFRQNVSANEVRKIAKKYRKNKKNVKIKGVPKKPKNSKRSGFAKKGKKSKRRTLVDTKLAAQAAVQRKERGTSATTEEGAIELARLRKYIQSRLPAEVRRNMGRPALINRTGRFSNSVQLINLVEGKDTILARYTYMLRPYETFENTGKKTWPLAYNPKTLIAKSIRNLAEGRISQKLTVRRV